MGREIKRVAVDFGHPVGEVWPGYLNQCDVEDCDGCAGCEKTEPPLGEAWQCWETVSEGSPVSPAFASRDALVAWLVENEDCSPVAAEKFIEDGWAPSMMATGFGVFMGVQIAAGIPVAIEWRHTKAGDYTTIAPGTAIRHLESGVTGKVQHRFPPPRGEYYLVTWDRGLPSLLAEDPSVDPNAPMDAGCKVTGFEVIPS